MICGMNRYAIRRSPRRELFSSPASLDAVVFLLPDSFLLQHVCHSDGRVSAADSVLREPAFGHDEGEFGHPVQRNRSSPSLCVAYYHGSL